MHTKNTKIPRSCQWCGATFSVKPSQAKDGRGRFCSRPCSDAARRPPPPPPVVPAPERFEQRVNGSGECHLWTGPVDKDGYGYLSVNNRRILAHRFAWERANGPVPEGLFVLHSCPGGDNPRCVNLAHLRADTHLANVEDRCSRGRQTRGETNGTAKLTADAVRAIRAAHGVPQRVLAARFGIGMTQVGRIQRREQWAHIP